MLNEKQLAERFRDFRKNLRFTIKDMADKVGITYSGYNKIENCEVKMTYPRMLELCEIFNISLAELLGISEKANISAPLPAPAHEVTPAFAYIKAQLEKLYVSREMLSKALEYENLQNLHPHDAHIKCLQNIQVNLEINTLETILSLLNPER